MQKGPKGGIEVFNQRRKQLLEKLKGGVAIIPSAMEYLRNDDVHFPFRQESNFYYLTGFTEPESAIVLDPSSPHPFTLFVRENDPTRELWDGFRYGLDGAAEYFGPNKVYPISEFKGLLPELFKNADQIFYKINQNKEYDQWVFEAIEKARKLRGRTGIGAAAIVDIKQIIGEMRLFKSAEELALLKKATEISAHGHLAGMKICKPGIFEYEVEAEIEREFRRRGADRLGYGSIVGSGANATVLHYVTNADKMKDGDFLLVDAGAEYGYFTGDITRTFPVSGRFSPAQKKFYEAVLKVQKDCIKFVKPGVKLADVHGRAINGLTDAMLELGLLKGNKKEIVEKRGFFKYFPHGTSHWLGMDVHDAGLYNVDGQPRRLEPNMCFTVEPGMYVPQNDTEAPKEYRGLGVRIEDDVVVTAAGCEVLTSLAPKEVSEIEAIVGKSV
jgi:Xaa-Pro aminopeptidase